MVPEFAAPRTTDRCRGDDAVAIMKSTEVMIAREAETPEPAPKTRRQRRK